MLSINGASSFPNVSPTRTNSAVARQAPSKSVQSRSASNGPSNGVRVMRNRDEVSISSLTQNLLNQGLNNINPLTHASVISQIQKSAKQIMQNDFNRGNERLQ